MLRTVILMFYSLPKITIFVKKIKNFWLNIVFRQTIELGVRDDRERKDGKIKGTKRKNS